MKNTLILQSHRTPLPYPWLEACLASVQSWCEENDYQYRFVRDELLSYVPDAVLQKTREQVVIATDLARLRLIQQALTEGFNYIVWMDADFLIFRPSDFVLPMEEFACGREVWVQQDDGDTLKVYKKVHNAFMLFHKHNSFLPFYADTAERLVLQNQGSMPPQYIGPKLLTALHNIVGFTVMEPAAMFSPLVIKNILQGGGKALELFIQHSTLPIAAANLCCSSVTNNQLSNDEMQRLISLLLEDASVLLKA